MSDLNTYIKKNITFLKLEDGQTFTGIYKGYSIIPDRFKPGKDTVSYLLQYPDSQQTITWNQGSSRVAVQMNKILAGTMVSITRQGEGMGTKYKIVAAGLKDEEEQVPF